LGLIIHSPVGASLSQREGSVLRFLLNYNPLAQPPVSPSEKCHAL